jgi:hypothetical protein
VSFLSCPSVNLAVEWRWRPDNPVKGVERYDEQKQDRWQSDDELRRLCTALDVHPDARAANAVRLQLLTAAWFGEVLASRKEDLNLGRGVLDQAGTSDQAEANGASTAQRPSAGAGGVDRRGERAKISPPIPRQQARSAVAGYQEILERRSGPGWHVNYRRHDNRRTCESVTSRFQRPWPGNVRRLLEHTTTIMTKRYAQVADDPLRAAN